jgi:hypothetical protein
MRTSLVFPKTPSTFVPELQRPWLGKTNLLLAPLGARFSRVASTPSTPLLLMDKLVMSIVVSIAASTCAAGVTASAASSAGSGAGASDESVGSAVVELVDEDEAASPLDEGAATSPPASAAGSPGAASVAEASAARALVEVIEVAELVAEESAGGATDSGDVLFSGAGKKAPAVGMGIGAPGIIGGAVKGGIMMGSPFGIMERPGMMWAFVMKCVPVKTPGGAGGIIAWPAGGGGMAGKG